MRRWTRLGARSGAGYRRWGNPRPDQTRTDTYRCRVSTGCMRVHEASHGIAPGASECMGKQRWLNPHLRGLSQPGTPRSPWSEIEKDRKKIGTIDRTRSMMSVPCQGVTWLRPWTTKVRKIAL